nr:MAG: ORF1 [Torque teno midi virus]
MPFYYWRRRQRWFRKRPYYTTRFKKRRRRRRKRTRIYRRQRPHRFTRRRYRRTKKVRKKKKKINIAQWQPDAIKKCKVKGTDVLILGGEGKQFECYTDVKLDFVPPKAPMGGGFGAEVFTLYDLYTDYKFHKNIWTASNVGMDLIRFTGMKFTFYRHPETDFVIKYQRNPPFDINKYTYPSYHPHVLMQDKHKIVLLSAASNPRGKLKKTVYIKPPKLMQTKWFFARDFCHAQLLLLTASIADFRYSYLGCCNQSNQISFFYLNRDFYQNANWGEGKGTSPYIPYDTFPSTRTFNFKYLDKETTRDGTFSRPQNYNESVNYDTGFFNSKLLRMTAWTQPAMAHIPTAVARYNPSIDDGKSNMLYLTSIFTKSYTPPTTDETILIRELPLWLSVWGFLQWVTKQKKDKAFLRTHCVVLMSKALQITSTATTNPYILPLDLKFVNGRPPYEEYLTTSMKTSWYPTVYYQMETLNAIAECGPFVPKYAETKRSTWELKYSYTFYFKFGGPFNTDKEVTDPCKQNKFPIPGDLPNRIQIQNPLKQETDSFLHAWDFRRGQITDRAFKRMCKNLQIDSDFQTDAEEVIPKKKARLGRALQTQEEKTQEIQECLQDLCKENTFPETQEANLQQFINFQQEQQLNIKKNILKLLTQLKERQQCLELQTGLFN